VALSYVLDEQLRGALWHALQQHNAGGVNVVDVVRVGDPPDLPLGIQDPDLLLWAEDNGRVLVTLDVNTMPGHLTLHLQSGHHSPGVVILRVGHTLPVLVSNLVLAAHVYDPADVQDKVTFLP
jgi:Domain of unknown function (DUF5615)